MNASSTERLKIIHYPDPVLNRKARPLTPEEIETGKTGSWDLRELVERMIHTMYEADGIGLAAPQVNLSLRLFVGDISKERDQPFVILNPGLSDMHGEAECEEGCLSVPEIRAKVTRAERVIVSGFNVDGNPVKFEADGLMARVCQHEYDHLDGKLFIQRIGSASRFLLRRSLRALEEDYEILKRRRARSGSR
jgi:peptide deformylase